MTLTTYGGLKAAVAAWATKTSLSAQMDDFCGWAHQEICRKLRAPVLYARADVAISGETATAPDRFLAAKRFFLDLTPRQVLHQVDAAQVIDMTSRGSPAVYPSVFALEGTDTLTFAPLFGGSYTGKLLYYQAPALMTADGDTNVVLAKYPFLYLYGALEALFRFLEDDNNSQIYGGQFGALIASINAEEARDAMRGPIVAPAASGAVV